MSEEFAASTFRTEEGLDSFNMKAEGSLSIYQATEHHIPDGSLLIFFKLRACSKILTSNCFIWSENKL
jgi:hypothetical protein